MDCGPIPLRHCLNIKSRKHPDICCKSVSTHGDFCSRHYKNPVRHKNKCTLDTEQFLTPKFQLAAQKIQSTFKHVLKRNAYRRQGPSVNILEISNNSTELHSLEGLETIPRLYLWSYGDEKKHIWTFDIRSFSHMGSTGLKNPYTQLPLTERSKISLETRLNWLRKKGYVTHFMNDTDLSAEQSFNLRVLDVFMKMDFLGYHSNSDWFLDLELKNQIILYRELYELWTFRLQLSQFSKDNICPDMGAIMKYDPSRIRAQREIRWWRKLNLEVMDALVSRASDKTNRALGALYCLTALCKVSNNARSAYHWLTWGNT